MKKTIISLLLVFTAFFLSVDYTLSQKIQSSLSPLTNLFKPLDEVPDIALKIKPLDEVPEIAFNIEPLDEVPEIAFTVEPLDEVPEIA